jgi:UDP-3-O-acyl N-acetylglucosamine deacetylase
MDTLAAARTEERPILVVDDEERIRESIREILTDEGYRVIEAPDGSKVIELVRAERPCLILLDIWMPRVDGIGLLREIKEQDPDIDVIMISGHGNIHTAVTAAKLGAFDFIEKPLSLEGLLHAVRRALGELPAVGQRKLDDGGSPCPAAPVERRPGTRMRKQRTLRGSVVVSGQGLHSGIKTGLILHPLPPNSGILFTGISAEETVPAHLDYVGSTGYATLLRGRGMVVGTVEHFLAVLHAYGIANLLVKVQGEVPIMDGSALEFCRLVEEAGILEQNEDWPEIVVDRPYQVQMPGGEFIRIEPAEVFRVRYTLQYPKPVGEQEYSYSFTSSESFKEQIAPARTFGFLKDVEKLEKLGLVNGGKLSNCILLDDEKVLNTELRFPDEFARHKVLDILGDFYLLGRPIRGMITARMTGHSDNIELLREIRRGMGL